jgi:hypothetical protein
MEDGAYGIANSWRIRRYGMIYDSSVPCVLRSENCVPVPCNSACSIVLKHILQCHVRRACISSYLALVLHFNVSPSFYNTPYQCTALVEILNNCCTSTRTGVMYSEVRVELPAIELCIIHGCTSNLKAGTVLEYDR